MAPISVLVAKLLFLTVAFGVFFAHGYLAPLGRRFPGIKYEPNEYVIQVTSQSVLPAHLDAVRALVRADAGSELFDAIHINDDFVAYGARVSPSVVERIRGMEGVIRIEPNAYLELYASQLSPPNWGLDRIDQRALPLNDKYIYSDKAGEGVDVYIVDTGINLDHVEFANKNAIWGVTTPRNSEDKDLNGHGSHVASTVCGARVGVAKKSRCIAVKVMKDSGLGTVFDITAGLSWVSERHQNGTNKSVVNMSLGSPISNPIIDASVAALVRSGVVTVVAAGNSDRNACFGSPAGQEDVITVGASDRYDVRAYFSNWGSCVDFFAPGVNITAAWFDSNDGYFVASGTSMASPHGAGVAALILAEKDFGFGQEATRAEFVKLATPGVLSDIGEDSPNLLLFNNPPAARKLL